MNEKEKNVLLQQLWALVAQNARATQHSFEILKRMMKIAAHENGDEMTPNKQKVVSELRLQWDFIKTLREDLLSVAEKLDKAPDVPDIPELTINDDLWDTDNYGISCGLYQINDKISDFQKELDNANFKLMEVAG